MKWFAGFWLTVLLVKHLSAAFMTPAEWHKAMLVQASIADPSAKRIDGFGHHSVEVAIVVALAYAMIAMFRS